MKKKDKLPEDVCPTHTHLKLIPTRSTGQLICPLYECTYYRKKKT